MNPDDFYDYDPYFDDTVKAEECPTCWKTEDKCWCDRDIDCD
jgi:hypothetical protein